MPETASTDKVTARLAKVQRDLTDGAAYPHRVMELHAPHLLAAVERVLELCRDTDGTYLPPEAEVPVGEFLAAISAALLGEGADGG